MKEYVITGLDIENKKMNFLQFAYCFMLTYQFEKYFLRLFMELS